MKALILFLLSTTLAYADFYSIKETSIEGKEFSMQTFKKKVVLVVNIASQCGYTSQLEGLESLYKTYKDKGFVILGVPTNDFGGQTPQDDKEMKEFCQKKYQVTFPLLAKRTIQGKEKRVLYKYLTEEIAKNFQGEVGWNFEKFLINRKGEVIGRFKSSTGPEEKELTSRIEAALK